MKKTASPIRFLALPTLSIFALLVLLISCVGTPAPQAPQPEPGIGVTIVAGTPGPLATLPGTSPEATPAPTLVPLTSLDPAAPLSQNPALRRGTLPNGLAWTVLANGSPKNRAYFRLVVRAGSANETEDQRGLAHFVEHMAFNGTANFKKQDIIGYFESIGMKFGPEVNAYTSFDETVYMIEIPTDRTDTLPKALAILKDWAAAVSFSDEEIEKERKVILEEWRLGRGAESRIRDIHFPVLLKGSLYAQRLPIGLPDVIRNAPADRIRAFYRDWYRPENMMLVAVGDFDAAKVEQRIKDLFSPLKREGTPPPSPSASIPPRSNPEVSIATDPEQQYTNFSSYRVVPRKSIATGAAYRAHLADYLQSSLFQERLSELTQKPDAAFLYAYTGSFRLLRGYHAHALVCITEEDGLEAGIKALLAEEQRLQKHGFTASERQRGIQGLLNYAKKLRAEADKTDSSDIAGELIRNMLDGDSLISAHQEADLIEFLAASITLEEINVAARASGGLSNRVLMISAPDKAKALLPAADRTLVLARQAVTTDLGPWQEAAAITQLMQAPSQTGTSLEDSSAREKALGLTRLVLSNGAQVYVKTTAFKNDEVIFFAFSHGGLSLVEDKDFVSAQMAASLLMQTGLGQHDQSALDRFLAPRTASVSVSLDPLSETLSGSAAPRDLEVLFQLINLRMTSPRPDAAVTQAFLRQQQASLANRDADPEQRFFDLVSSTVFGNHFRMQPQSLERLARFDAARALAIYKARLGNAADFSFFFIGNASVEQIKTLAERYLATLPASSAREQYRDTGLRFARGPLSTEVRSGSEPKSFTALFFQAPLAWSYQESILYRMTADLLDIRLREVLREDQGGTYSIGVSVSPVRFPQPESLFEIFFGSDPARADELATAAKAEIQRLQTTGPSNEDVAKIVSIYLREQEQGLEENRYWQQLLRIIYYHDLPGDTPELYKKAVASFSAEAVKRVLQAAVKLDRAVQVRLLPADRPAQ